MRTVLMERRCPKCGEPMYLLPDSDITMDGLRTTDAICENCLHVEQVTTILATRFEGRYGTDDCAD